MQLCVSVRPSARTAWKGLGSTSEASLSDASVLDIAPRLLLSRLRALQIPNRDCRAFGSSAVSESYAPEAFVKRIENLIFVKIKCQKLSQLDISSPLASTVAPRFPLASRVWIGMPCGCRNGCFMLDEQSRRNEGTRAPLIQLQSNVGYRAVGLG